MLDLLHHLAGTKRMKSLLSLVFAVFVITGCDGGIFGTGDSNSDGPIIGTTPSSNTNPVDSDQTLPGGSDQESAAEESGAVATDAPEGDTDDEDGQTAEGESMPPPESAPDAMANEAQVIISFDNTLAGYPGVEPQLRFVNASSGTIRALLGRATGEAETIEIAPFSVTPQAILEIGESIIDLTPADAVAPAVRIIASLGLSSVTTVLIQPTDNESSSVTALALETQSVTSDDSLTQLRLVAPAWDLPLSSGLWSLAPSGANPGSVDATLSAIVDAESDPSYTSITAGDYELRLDGQSINLPTLTLNGSTVTTLVLSREMGDLRLIEVLDSDIAGLRPTPGQ